MLKKVPKKLLAMAMACLMTVGCLPAITAAAPKLSAKKAAAAVEDGLFANYSKRLIATYDLGPLDQPFETGPAAAAESSNMSKVADLSKPGLKTMMPGNAMPVNNPADSGICTVIGFIEANLRAYGYYWALGLDSTCTAGGKQDAGETLDLLSDFDVHVPKDATPFRDFGYNETVPAGNYDFALFGITSYVGIYNHNSVSLDSNEIYLFSAYVTPQYSVAINIYIMEPYVTLALARPSYLDMDGGESNVSFDGIFANGTPVEIYLNNTLMTDAWATGMAVTGDPMHQEFTINFPANLTGADQVYSVKLAGLDTAAEVIVAGTHISPVGKATVTLTVIPFWTTRPGYQLLLDSTHTAYGNNSYNRYDYFVPEDAPDSFNNTVKEGSVSVEIPEGTYDVLLAMRYTNSMWYDESPIDDMFFASGHNYEFIKDDIGNYYLHIDGLSVEKFNVPVPSPVAGETPVITLPDSNLYKNVQISWTPDVAPLTVFHNRRVYTAHVTFDEALPGSLAFVKEFKIGGHAASNVEISGGRVSMTYTYPITRGITDADAPAMAKIVLTVGNPYNDNTGYQMLIDTTCTAPVGPSDWEIAYSSYNMFIPADAANGTSVVLKETVAVDIPAGIYHVTLANRDSGRGRFYDVQHWGNFDFEEGKVYTFTKNEVYPIEPAVTLGTPVSETPVLTGVSGANGSFTANFNEVPDADPTSADFTVEYSINGGTRKALDITGFTYDFAVNCGLNFMPIAKTGEKQNITVYVTFDGVTASYGFTLEEAGKVVIAINTPTMVTVGKGKAINVGFTLTEGSLDSIKRITWTSLNAKIASVEPKSGMTEAAIKGVAAGSTIVKLTVETVSGDTLTYNITVKVN